MPIDARYHEQAHEATTPELDQGKVALLELPANGVGGRLVSSTNRSMVMPGAEAGT